MQQNKFTTMDLLRYTIVFAVLIVFMFPIYMMITTSFKAPAGHPGITAALVLHTYPGQLRVCLPGGKLWALHQEHPDCSAALHLDCGRRGNAGLL